MKKRINKILPFIFFLICCVGIISCSDDDRQNLDLSGGIRIESFSINGTDGTINDENGTVQILLPLGTDLTKLTPQITLSDRAVINPAGNEAMDLSKATKFRVTNGNLYKDYMVVASHIKGEILSFSIGKYKGTIDNDKRTVHVRYPKSEDVTKLTPEFVITSGATVTPAQGTAVDFTNPVTYTLSYMNETFPYVVTVEKVDIKPIAFLGVANNASSIENMDEKAAYDWFAANVPDFEYVSFNDIKNGKDLANFAAIWWHSDGNTQALPTAALEPTVVTSLKTYYQNGGSFFFSSWAVQYVSTLGIAKDGKAVNNMWGDGNDAFVVGDDWGLCFTGNESHPIFAGLQKPVGVNNKIYLVAKGVKAKGHNAIWNFEWGDYANNILLWTTKNGAINLASYHWDDQLKGRSVMFEYPKVNTSGITICIGVESYDWYNEDGSIVNPYKGNIETLTSNIFNYLLK